LALDRWRPAPRGTLQDLRERALSRKCGRFRFLRRNTTRTRWRLQANVRVARRPGRDRASRLIIVRKTKSRHYKGSLTPCQLYQVTLYLGMAARRYRQPARTILLFGDGRRVPVEFDPATYQHLLALFPDCRRDTGHR